MAMSLADCVHVQDSQKVITHVQVQDHYCTRKAKKIKRKRKKVKEASLIYWHTSFPWIPKATGNFLTVDVTSVTSDVTFNRGAQYNLLYNAG